MANVLKMTIVEAIHSLRSAGLSCRAIARRLGIHRDTVSRHLEQVPDPISKP
ncbi:MAG: helix-turn-helix domain-containing protein, partial [Planctomycetaceae bacterium]